MSLRILGLIPARGGSKGVQNKNIRTLLGSTLVQRAYSSAQESGCFSKIVLSTDCEIIAEHGKHIGISVPFIRPPSLASDEAPMIGVVLHALDSLLGFGESFDAVFLLQPTSPLRTAHQIRSAVELLKTADSVCSVVPIPLTHCPHYVMKIDESGLLNYFLEEGKKIGRRQDVPQAYTRDGTIFLAREEVLRSTNSFYGPNCSPLILHPDEVLSIDSEMDWARAESILREKNA